MRGADSFEMLTFQPFGYVRSGRVPARSMSRWMAPRRSIHSCITARPRGSSARDGTLAVRSMLYGFQVPMIVATRSNARRQSIGAPDCGATVGMIQPIVE